MFTFNTGTPTGPYIGIDAVWVVSDQVTVEVSVHRTSPVGTDWRRQNNVDSSRDDRVFIVSVCMEIVTNFVLLLPLAHLWWNVVQLCLVLDSSVINGCVGRDGQCIASSPQGRLHNAFTHRTMTTTMIMRSIRGIAVGRHRNTQHGIYQFHFQFWHLNQHHCFCLRGCILYQ